MDKHLPSRGPRPGFALIPANAGIQYLPLIGVTSVEIRQS